MGLTIKNFMKRMGIISLLYLKIFMKLKVIIKLDIGRNYIDPLLIYELVYLI